MEYMNSLAVALTGALFVAFGEVARVSVEVTRELRATTAKRAKARADGENPGRLFTVKGAFQGVRVVISAFGAVLLAIGSYIALLGE